MNSYPSQDLDPDEPQRPSFTNKVTDFERKIRASKIHELILEQMSSESQKQQYQE